MSIPQRPLGSTGQSVSILGLGGYHIGQQVDEKESLAIMHRALSLGINFFDNCWDYNGGQSEERMGKVLAESHRRDQIVVMTKLDARRGDIALLQLEQSLKRLRTDCIDLVQLHEVMYPNDPADSFAPDGVFEALARAREQGKLRFIGFTGHKSPKAHLAMLHEAEKHAFHFDAVQMPLNILDHHFESFERTVLPYLVEHQIGVLGMKSNASGHICAQGIASAEECLRYAMSLETSVVISGMETLDVLEKNAAVAQTFTPMSDEERAALLSRSKSFASGKWEPFKTTQEFDGTTHFSHWLTSAQV